MLLLWFNIKTHGPEIQTNVSKESIVPLVQETERDPLVSYLYSVVRYWIYIHQQKQIWTSNLYLKN